LSNDGGKGECGDSPIEGGGHNKIYSGISKAFSIGHQHIKISGIRFQTAYFLDHPIESSVP
jgi:hypothetical protein